MSDVLIKITESATQAVVRWQKRTLAAEDRVAELEARKDRCRSAAEIIADCHALAVRLAERDGWVPVDPHRLRMYAAGNDQANSCWERAVVACDLLRNESVADALRSEMSSQHGEVQT